jgi:DNA ligase 1
MSDLQDGESAQVQGSARTPYILKNIGGVYSCSCPAWRNQSLPIERRSCKHLRGLRGEEAERERLGSLPIKIPPATALVPKNIPGFLLAERWENDADLSGYWMKPNRAAVPHGARSMPAGSLPD